MDYVNAIPKAIRHANNIIAENLVGYKCVREENVFPPIRMLPGGFCFSFQLECQGKPDKCLRMWWRDDVRAKNLNHILRVSEYFKNNDIKYVIPYEYFDHVLKLYDGTNAPGVIMDWLDGQTMMSYVKRNYMNSSAIRKLADDFYDMVQYHKENGMAHGDLSDENIIIKPSGEICLIDYDSYYVDSWGKEIPQSTSGIGPYQHPNRMKGKDPFLNLNMDNFSHQVIYLSLLAISKDPNLFTARIEESKGEKEKGILFKDVDMESYEAFTSPSSLYNRILEINDSEIQKRLSQLCDAFKSPLSEICSIVPEPIAIQSEMASFCGICGHKFDNQIDLFCPDCGTKRENL